MPESVKQAVLDIDLSNFGSLFPGIKSERFEFPELGKKYEIPDIKELLKNSLESAAGVNDIRRGVMFRYSKAVAKNIVEALPDLILARFLGEISAANAREAEENQKTIKDLLTHAEKHLNAAFQQAHVMKTSGVPPQ